MNFTHSDANRFTFRAPDTNCRMIFNRMDGTTIGTLDFSGPKMVFTGDAEDSAMIFMDHIARVFAGRLAKEYEAGRENALATIGALV